jgi:hypothetical protein
MASKMLTLDLPPGSELYADAGYPCYWIEATLREIDGVDPQICYARTMVRRQRPEVAGYKKMIRHSIENTFSAIKGLFGHQIHASTYQGFRLKLSLFVLAFTLSKALLS